MRTFDYRHLPQSLFDGKVGDANVRLYEGRGKLDLLKQVRPDELNALRKQAHFDIARYVSIDRIIESTAMDYYDALNACVEKWDRGQNDYAPFALYWLTVVHEAYRQLFEKMERAATAPSSKTERVRLFVRQSADPVTKRQVREAFPDVSEATIEAALGAMVKEGVVEKLGAGRSTSYRCK